MTPGRQYPPGYFVDGPKRACAECGGDFIAKSGPERFCTVRCQQRWFNRMHRRAREVYPLLYEMATSYKRRGLLTAITRIVRRHVLEDRAAGRPAPPLRRSE